MRKTLLLLIAAVTSLSAFAHRIPEWSYAKELTTKSGLVAQSSATNDPKTWWVTDAKINQQSFGAKVGTTSYEKGMCANGAEHYFLWRANISNIKDLRKLAFSVLDENSMTIKVITGTNFNVTTTKAENNVKTEYTPNPHVTVKMELIGYPYNAAGECYTAVYDFGSTQDDVRLVQELKPISFSVDTPDGKMFDAVKEIKVTFGNLNGAKDWVALKHIKFNSKPKGQESHWVFPSLSCNKQNFHQKPGEFIIQAEDFDEPWINGRTAHSSALYNDWAQASIAAGQLQDGYGYPSRDREYDSTCANAFVHVMNMGGYVDGLQQFQGWEPSHGVNDWDGNRFGFVNFAQQNWDATYDGPKEADGTATLENLADFYGAWTEYTFNVEEELYADFSIRTAVHNANFQAYRAGSPNCPKVTGENVNYFSKYGGAYRIFIDGEPVRSNWIARPSADIQNVGDFSTWIPNVDEVATYSARAAEAPSYFVYSMPNHTHGYGTADQGTTWSPVYKSDIGQKLLDEGAIDATGKAVFDTPDYANVFLTPGKHTLKVQAMGGRTTFDEIKVQAHANPDTPTAIESIVADNVALEDANAPVEYYNLQGMRVENPANGIFIRRQGTRATKVVIR